MDNNNNGKFTYTYSATQQEEIKRIRAKYLPQDESKMELLRRLDKSAEKSGTAASIAVGTIGTLLFGTGMACVLEWTDFLILGIVVGAIGIIGISLAFPIYKVMTKKQREKLMPQILQITDELMQ